MISKFDSPQTARDYLVHVGKQNDGDINLFEASLALAAAHRPSIVIDKYRIHLDKMASDLNKIFDSLCADENGDGVSVRVKALAHVLYEKNAYVGDTADYHNLQNVDIMRVIDRRLGMPITLCIIAIALCRKLDWSVSGINFPGHFLMQMDHDGERLMIDPFEGCKILSAPDLRGLIKRQMGDDAELSNEYYAPCSNRDTLLRLQNNIKYRLIESEHYDEALNIVTLMMVFAPNDNRLRLDRAVLLSRVGQTIGAMEYLQAYIDDLGNDPARHEAVLFMKELTNQLN